MSSAPIALEVAAAPADVAARPRRPVRHSWWVVGGLGVVALLAFQFIEELAELKAFGQRYLSSGSAPHAVVARQRDAPRPPPPPRAPSEAPRKSRASEGGAPGAPSAGGTRTEGVPAAAGPTPTPTLEKDGWVAWPPPAPPPGIVAAPTDARVETEAGADARDGVGDGGGEGRSDDAAGPDPGPSSSGDGRRGGESGVSVGGGEASAEGVETDGPKAPPSLETHGWVAWPPPNPPPPA